MSKLHAILFSNIRSSSLLLLPPFLEQIWDGSSLLLKMKHLVRMNSEFGMGEREYVKGKGMVDLLGRKEAGISVLFL